jgi:hypothetical protein
MGINLAFTTGIPATNNNPSNDQTPMQVNYNSTNSWTAIDHYGFNDNNGGLHKWVRIPIQGGVPPGTIAGEGTLYTKTVPVTGIPTSEGELFYTPDNGGLEYQLTRTISASHGTFGVYAGYGAPPANVSFKGGWTFLPGGLLHQYGLVSFTALVSQPYTITFPTAFTTTNYSVLITFFNTNTSGLNYNLNTLSQTSFVLNTSLNFINGTGIFWQAIGV